MICYELGLKWHKLPWEIRQMPSTEFHKLIALENAYSFVHSEKKEAPHA